VTDARVLVDASERDDAAVFRIADDRALVATTDFFTPIVDDAYDFGRIAAANALGDLYALGATPLFVLNLVGWPRDRLPLELLGDVLRGGGEIVREAGAFVLGGHSIDDPEPKYGLVALGEAHPDRLLRVVGARPDDVLVLTKPIGTGVLTTALKRDLAPAADLAEAVRVMTTLNAGAARGALTAGASAATDVTGFGLLGHLRNVLEASGVSCSLRADRVPLLAGALELAERGAVPGGTQRNLEALGDVVHWDSEVPEPLRILLADAQTSGGLLIAVPPMQLPTLLEELGREQTPAAAVVGVVEGGTAGTVHVHAS
jgi:selenide,water dikinase